MIILFEKPIFLILFIIIYLDCALDFLFNFLIFFCILFLLFKWFRKTLKTLLHDLSCLHTSHYITLIICNYYDFRYWGPEKESWVRKSKSQMAGISSILIIFKENAWQYHGIRHNF